MSVLLVNETRILRDRPDREAWWRTWRSIAERVGLVTLIVTSPHGDRLRIDCHNEGHAMMLHEYLRLYGIPRRAIKRARP